MAASTPDFVSELVQQMKSLTLETNEETLLDLALGHVSDAAAEKLGLKQGNKHCHYESYLKLVFSKFCPGTTTRQTAVYLLTKASLLGSCELTKAALMDSVDIIGIGTSLAKIDMTGFAIAQLRAEVAELGRKLDVILGAPLKVAVQNLTAAMIKMEHHDIEASVFELYELKKNQSRGSYMTL